MKIAFTADLHQPITPLWQIEQLVNEISEFGPDVLILGGDLGESVQDFEKCLRLFRKSFTCPLLVYPGNHDLWVRRFSDSKKYGSQNYLKSPRSQDALSLRELLMCKMALRFRAPLAGTIILQ